MKKKWLVLLLALAVVFTGAGLYLIEGPEWIKNTYYDYYNRGVSAYLGNQVEEALNDFTHVANNSKDLWLKSLALAQVGTIIGEQAFDEEFSAESRYQIAQYSIEILKEAVINNPDNEEAKYNLELLMNQLPNLLQKMEEEEGDGSGEESSPDPGYSHGGGERGY